MLVLVVACGGARTRSADTSDLAVRDRERAVAIASQTGADAGYAPADYQLVEAKQEDDGSWYVFFDHVPPGRPGAHFSVVIDARTGSPRLIHGK